MDKLDRELPIKLTKVKREDCEELGTHRAVYSRCDRNGHMNNTVYADLICDALPLEVWRTHTVTDVILYYHKEVPMGRKHPPVPRRSGRKPLVYGWVAGDTCNFEAEITLAPLQDNADLTGQQREARSVPHKKTQNWLQIFYNLALTKGFKKVTI